MNSENEKIKELAELPMLEYGKIRKEAAKQLNVSVTWLDKAIKEARKSASNICNNGLIFPEVMSWHETVDARELLNLIAQTINRCVVIEPHYVDAISLWVVFSYCIDAFNTAPILNITSPEKQCGKTTLLTLLNDIVKKSLSTSNISPAALFRTVEKYNPTLLIDEADTFFNDERSELRGIVNSGHTRASAFVIRTTGEDHEPTRFTTWCAKCIAGIGKLPETIIDRSIIIRLTRKLENQAVEKLRDLHKSNETLLDEIRQKCTRFAEDNLERMKSAKIEAPNGLNNRAFDNWEPLLILAEIAGTEWFQRTTQAATKIGSTNDAQSAGSELLQDIKNVWEDWPEDRIPSNELIKKLCENEEAPWLTYNRGNPISTRQLIKKLEPYGIKPKQLWIIGKNLRGYERSQFDDVFKRYNHTIESDFQCARTLEPVPDKTYRETTNARSDDSLAYKKTLEPASE